MASTRFEIRFDFIDHELAHFKRATASSERFELEPQSVADFYKEVMSALDELKLPVKIDTVAERNR